MTEMLLDMGEYGFNPWALPPGLVALCMLAVSLNALLRKDRFMTRTIGAAWGLCAVIWLGSVALMYSSREAEIALVWAKMGLMGSVFLAPLAMNFAESFLDQRSNTGRIPTFGWLLALFFAAAAAFTDYLISGVARFSWGFYPQFGTLGAPLVVYGIASFAWVTARHTLLRPRFQSSRADRARHQAVRIGALVANVSLIDFFAAFGWKVYPCGWIGVLGVLIATEYAHRRHGLWTIGHALQAMQILDAIDDGVLVVEDNFDVYFSSRTANELFGAPQATDFSLAEATNGVLNEAIHKKVLNGASMPLLEMSLKNDCGEVRTFSVLSSVARDARGQAVGVIYVFRDTTAYTEVQENLRSMQADLIDVHRKARDEAEKRLKKIEDKMVHLAKIDALGQMAGGVAHDFNNLLTAIIGGCDLVSSRLGRDHPVSRDLMQIRKSGEQGAKLTGQLLAYSRKQPLNPHVLDINQVISEAIKLLERLIPENIDIIVHSETTVPYVSAEPGQLTQVLLNLAINARDAMPDGGRLTIRTCNTIQNDHIDSSVRSQGLDDPGEYIAISVEDTGCGMNAQTRRCVFDPFFTTKVEGKGTGLGLSTAYGVVRQIGGDILVESQIGKGSAFKLLLPVVNSSSTAEMIISGSEAPRAEIRTTILVVEDEVAVRDLLAGVLASSGHRIHRASDGVEAIRILREEPEVFGLVLTDVVMPRMGGRELAAHIAEYYPQTKVIAMSGYLGQNAMMGFHDLVSCILVKPFGQDKLLSTVQSVLLEHKKQNTSPKDPSISRKAFEAFQ